MSHKSDPGPLPDTGASVPRGNQVERACSTRLEAPQSPKEQRCAPGTRQWIVFDPQWCRTCRVCEAMCAIAKEGTARPALARINVFFDEFDERQPVSAQVCFQCEEAACLEACPSEAMIRDPRTGAVVVDEERCVGCMLCRRACPWDVPKRHPERKVAIKCDLCAEREGGPLCVAMCPLSGKALRCERSAVPVPSVEGAGR